MNVIQFPIRNPLPFSEYNNPNEYDVLTEYEKQALDRWINEALKPRKTKHYYYHHSSYGLKHLFERCGYGFYITNGQFKGGMIEAGFEPKNHNELNWNFKLGKRAGEMPVV